MQSLADLYSNNSVEGLLEGFKCGKCGKEAFKRCSKCKGTRTGQARKEGAKGVFGNYLSFLAEIGFQPLSTKNDFDRSLSPKHFQLEFKCTRGHESSMSVASFNNKRSKFRKQGGSFCAKCPVTNMLPTLTTREQSINEIFTRYDHTLLILEDDNKTIGFICGKCGNNTREDTRKMAAGDT